MGAKLAKLQTHLTAGLLSIVVVTCDRAAIPGPRHSGIISVQQSSERARPSRYAQYQRYLEYAGRDPMSQFCTRISHTAQRADVCEAQRTSDVNQISVLTGWGQCPLTFGIVSSLYINDLGYIIDTCMREGSGLHSEVRSGVLCSLYPIRILLYIQLYT